LEVSKRVQPKESIPTGKDFGHMAFDYAPIVGYLNHGEDFDLEYLEIVRS